MLVPMLYSRPVWYLEAHSNICQGDVGWARPGQATSVVIVRPSLARAKPINFDCNLCAMHVHILSAMWGDFR